MKKGLCRLTLSGMLMSALVGGQVFLEEKDRKEKMQIIAVEKKERDKSGSGEAKQRRSGDHKP
ncbi:MAG: hypothetical protein ACJ74J_19665 [Blastocatellia bacterium]